GINIILYFAPRLLSLAGIEDPLSASITLGVTNLIFTFIGLKLIDVIGRRSLLILGCIGYLVSLSVCTYAFLHFNDLKVVSTSIDMLNGSAALEQTTNENIYMTEEDRQNKMQEFAIAKEKFLAVNDQLKENGLGINIEPTSNAQELASAAVQLKSQASDRLGFTSSMLLICMILFIAAHALGSGTIIWVFVSEIFPAHFRAAGQAVGSFTHWIFAAVLTLVFPIFIANFDVGYMFAFFAFMMLLQLLWALFIMPETKGKTLEDLASNLVK
ncbi:MAG: MFS transporter, partial [Anaerobiospirillum succiniciproducens]